MRVSNPILFLVLSAVLVACFGNDEAAGGPMDETDASPTQKAPDAAPVPDAVPGAPDASPPDAGPPPVSFNQEIVPILMARCGGCHLKAMGGAGGLSLGVMAELAYGALVDKPTHGPAPACSGLKLVNAASNDPTQSSLYVRLMGSSCGTRMPKGTPPLPADQMALFARWITQGAHNN